MSWHEYDYLSPRSGGAVVSALFLFLAALTVFGPADLLSNIVPTLIFTATAWLVFRSSQRRPIYDSPVLTFLLLLAGVALSVLFIIVWILGRAVGDGLEEDAKKRSGQPLFGIIDNSSNKPRTFAAPSAPTADWNRFISRPLLKATLFQTPVL